MEQRIQIRIGNLPPDDWRADLESKVEDGKLKSSVKLLDPETKKPGSAAAIDPQIVAATITGGASIIVALIPVIVAVFRKKTEKPSTIVNVTLHGTSDSKSIQVSDNEVTQETLDAVFASIGDLTEVDVN